VSVGAGVYGDVVFLTTSTGVGAVCPPPQPIANRMYTIPAIRRRILKIVICYAANMPCRFVTFLNQTLGPAILVQKFMWERWLTNYSDSINLHFYVRLG